MLLIIACGNSLRQDDGAGSILAERLKQAWSSDQIKVERIVVHQLTPELALEIAREEVTVVLFVDTRVVGPTETFPAIQLSQIDLAAVSPSLGHHLDPAALLLYTRLLYGREQPAWQITIPGVDFGHGEELSAATRQALAAAPALLADWQPSRRAAGWTEGIESLSQ